MSAAIELKNVNVKLEKTSVLHDINLVLPAGKVTGLLGPSGSGKTTLMRVIVGLQKPKTGMVKVLGEPAGSKRLRPEVGYVTQAPSVYGDLTVLENLRFFGAMAGADGARVKQVMADVRLSEFAERLAGGLSGGQRARVSLAVALLGSPRLLVLDEPTVGLDPVLRQELWDQFHALAKRGVTLLVSSHVMDEAKRCDNLVLLRGGQVLAAASPAELMNKTHTHDVEGAFLRLVGGAA